MNRLTVQGDPGSSSVYLPTSTTFRSVRSRASEHPLRIHHESAKSHTPNVERPPSRAPIRRHGQMGRQLHASKYVPSTDHAGVPCRRILRIVRINGVIDIRTFPLPLECAPRTDIRSGQSGCQPSSCEIAPSETFAAQ